MKTLLSASIAATLLVGAFHAGAASRNDTVDFSSGTGGWVGLPQVDGQGSSIEANGGVGGSAGFRTLNVETWGLNWTNSTNPAFIGDFTQDHSVTFSLDIKVNNIFSIEDGIEVPRHLMVELRDYEHYAENGIWTSVWFDLGSISQADGWQHLSATIADTNSSALPAGWSYYDGTDATTLPQGVSFSSLLKGVDEIAFSTIVNGNFYDYRYFDVTVDNIGVTTAVPEPATYATLAAGLLVVGLMRARRRKNG
ncbi:PEP-CTERM sorting domain-containing protein [Paucibacter sp. R3-3]|uniref:PEP-CTERM sorting domain-containing protein n=1 Tax=Roseateles agri TaxID=3098619 RepID=A0ABU5DPM2_9BURK|nr:PEP-CTERM sorting domain-containing protein [Paucibacter sp. R3-3]MDY0746997.1 PEP-CTERM sorting domain-containing protein [Paucibacter sp. R3-3]